MSKQSDPSTTAVKKTAAKKTTAKATKQAGAVPHISANTTFSLTISQDKVAAARQKVLQTAQRNVKLEGFRHGKAPLAMVEQRLGEDKIRQYMAEEVLPEAYRQVILENKYTPMTDPDVQVVSMEPGKDWEFTVSIAQPPEITLGNYKKIVTDLKKTHELWKTEKKANQEEKSADKQGREEQQKLQVILQTLLEKITIPVPELLLRQETQRQMYELGAQLERLNMTLNQYLEKTQQTAEQIQQEIAIRTLMNLQVDFLLGSIVREEKLEVTHDEIHAVMPHDHDHGHHLSEEQHQQVAVSLLKQKATSFLLTL